MKVLLCAATELEISPTIALLASDERLKVDVLITGIGVLCTGYALAKALAAYRPDLVLQAGIAGSLDEKLNLGSTVAVSAECIGDLGVEEAGRFRSVFDLQLAGANVLPWVNGTLPNETPLLSTCGLPLVKAVTVNEITTSGERVTHYREVLGASVESMEGAALHYAALQEKLPFLQLRSVSNFIGERDKSKWQIKAAVINLNRELQRILKGLAA